MLAKCSKRQKRSKISEKAFFICTNTQIKQIKINPAMTFISLKIIYKIRTFAANDCNK
jgi:hypothetical protein